MIKQNQGNSFSADLLGEAVSLVEKVSPIALLHFRTGFNIELKGDNSPVTLADREIETRIRQILNSRYPTYGVLGEEHGIERGDRSSVWVIDPIDGTRAFITGHPLFGILLGLVENDVPTLGVVCMPALGETYAGQQGQGAFLSGDPISVSGKTNIADASIYINEADLILKHAPRVLTALSDLGRTRRFAHDCYSYVLLASGCIDAVVDFDLQPYDFIPTTALVLAAGGCVSDWRGNPITSRSDGSIVAAASSELHRSILAALAPVVILD